MSINSVTIAEKLLISSQQDQFKGADPFDGLNSQFFDYFPFLKKGKFGLIWTQLNKRSTINLRPLLAVPKMRNPKGIGLFILGLLEDYRRTQNKDYLDTATELADWLLTQQSDKSVWLHACWGYHFDWNARAFYVPKGKPNIITTIYVAQALFELSLLSNNQQYKQVAIDAADFIVNTLYCEHDERCFFAYIPGETTFVHNASLWGAAWVAKVASITDNQEYKALAIKVAQQSVSEQGQDGSWVYGSRHHHQFIDGFHTGYNLEALQMIKDSLNTSQFDDAIDKGFKYYKAELFESDGTAKYYNTNVYPLDMHCVSQAIFTLVKVGKTDIDITFAKKVIQRSIDTLYIENKAQFVYQKTKSSTNEINYIRWTQAWVYYCFAFYNRVTE
ncbi:aspartate-semialdehyde dehydrogenase [Psychromonas sp. Urea-02u-13]|uniref:aspartate-semialdehyde dehydrogenase n=1 Tax=Psychromonas sp. Urea-02u-13 TaxID=2058326 RepID=UPI000C32A5F5|nr:aspartate-semialdehyde dehydrogenase [Psychromonas sp. Urea-02u-13]PKG37532.1 aspartate-semialdehyde dehydrogenase [Psychromonas sp. Urea-02u-13]